MLFINTRPQDRAEALTQALQQQHIEVIDLPLLQLSAQPWSEPLANLYTQLPHTHIIVVVSPTAVDIGMEYLAQSQISLQDLQHIRWVAVGEKTAEGKSGEISRAAAIAVGWRQKAARHQDDTRCRAAWPLFQARRSGDYCFAR